VDRRKVIAVVLYVVGVLAVLFVAYQEQHVAPSTVLGYMSFYALGMALVVAAAVLWPNDTHTTSGQGNKGEEE
jgi:hypothetical protein